MSLINEALKKAQKQRTGETPSLTAMPSVGGESASRIARRGKPAGFNSLVLRLGLGVAGLAAIIAVTVILVGRKSPAPVAPPATTVAAPAPAIQPKPVEPAPAVTPAPAPASAPATVLVVPNTAAAAPARPAPSTTVVLTPVEAPPAAAPAAIQVAPEPAKPAVTRKVEPRAINFIESIRVAGIRASSSDRKVLMNDRVYRIGDTVEAEMGLKLAGITTNSLTFEDENGGRYTRNF